MLVLRISLTLSRAVRGFIPAILLFSIAALSAQAGSAPLNVDYGKLVSRADLHYATPVSRSEDGMPVGNGRMGTLVWTSPSALKFQINRVDVFGNDGASDSFPQRHTDYCGGCGFVDIVFPDYGANVFPTNETTEHLSCYDGEASIQGKGVQAKMLVASDADVMAVQISDQRPTSGTVTVKLRMLRPPSLRTLSQTAESKLETRNGRMVLTQIFREGNFYCASAVAVGLVGRDAQVREANAEEFHLVTAPKRGAFTVLIASAASFNRDEDVAAAALAQLAAAEKNNFSALEAANQKWWHEFWSKSFVQLHSADGIADAAERDYNYFLYLMASSSRGKYPTKFNGMLWTTGGDLRHWGGQYWGANQSCLYNNTLFAANHTELLDPAFDMLTGMLGACSLAAKQEWGSQGAYYPETVCFDGPGVVPDDVAAEMRPLYLIQKPWAERSKSFVDYAGTKLEYASAWNWIAGGRWENGRWVFSERGSGPYGPVTHIFSRGAKYAYQFWLRYEYTGDEQWLRDRAYPVLKAVAEFYRNFPNVKKEADGKYHIHYVNSNEGIWGATDTDEEISSMMGIFPVLIKASEILNVDADMRPVWKEFLENLAPLPRSDNPAVAARFETNAPPVWIRGLPPAFPPRDRVTARPDGNTMPEWFFDLCTLESAPEMFAIGSNTFSGFASSAAQRGTNYNARVGVLSKVPLVAAIMGRADAVQKLVPIQFNTNERGGVLMNRMDLREGAQTTSAQRLGNASDALHTALCGDLPSAPGQPPVIHVFQAWPKSWDARFQLLCRGGFMVSSEMKNGQIPFVRIESQLGGERLLRNPWTNSSVDLYRNSRKSQTLEGSLLKFPTSKGETIVVVLSGVNPASKEK